MFFCFQFETTTVILDNNQKSQRVREKKYDFDLLPLN